MEPLIYILLVFISFMIGFFAGLHSEKNVTCAHDFELESEFGYRKDGPILIQEYRCKKCKQLKRLRLD